MEPQSNPADKINVELVVPFVGATHKVFETMMSTKVQRKEVRVKNNNVMLGDITGVVGLKGQIVGTVMLSMPVSAAAKSVGRLLGEEVSGGVESETLRDGVGEITNIIAGQAKAALSTSKYKFEISTPAIVSGSHHEISAKKGCTCLEVIFETAEKELFSVEIAFVEAV
ncbi:MAG: chemotaxis protein CheX [Candidatus Hydrogenedentes bacterium]|nr:chemotaxis protein CheX [Candidatus Hydrogenedentota bacterium]